jgi:ATP/maltotriose-dependent transcriptional regulator MalT
MAMKVADDLKRAKEAYERRDWVAAYDGLSALDPGLLRGEDFARLATAAHLLGRRNDAVVAMQRAFQVNLDADETLAAVRCAYWLSMVLSQGGEAAVGSGWASRAGRLLEEVPGDVVERGYMRCRDLFGYIHGGQLDAAREAAADVAQYGQRFRDPDLLAMGLSCQGRLSLYSGDVSAGLRLLDEAMVAVATGELSPIFAGEVYCLMIEACQEISDYSRVVEWTSALNTWCASQPDLVLFTGQCAVHRGQLLRLRGALAEAIEEFDLAVQRYVLAETPAPAGLALSERGDVLRIRGDLVGAEASYAKAADHGHDPQPGLALLWAAQGRSDAAVAAVRRLTAEPRDPVHRSQLLPAAVEILVAAGETDESRTLADELELLAAAFGCAPLRAFAAYAAASVDLAQGVPSAAVPRLRQAVQTWNGLSAVYEVARCRTLIGTAYAQLGDAESATAERTAALQAFRDLGAAPAEREVTDALRPSQPGGLTGRELEVLRLVAAGRTNPEIASALVLSEKTVARHLSNIFGKLGVSSRTAAAAYAYERHLV